MARANTLYILRGPGRSSSISRATPIALARASMSVDSRFRANAISGRPFALDAAADVWSIERADVVVCINMIHISPWSSAVGLMRGAGRVLPASGLLFLYGPYRREGATRLRATRRSIRICVGATEWGVRDLEDVADLAGGAGFGPPDIAQMPANNLSVLFRRQAA